MTLHHFFQHFPDFGAFLLDHFFRGLHGCGIAFLFQAVEHEGFKQLKRHFLRQSTLVEFQMRSNNNNGTAGIIHPLTQQVLPEPALLALEHVAQRLQRTLVGSAQGTTSTPIIEQG